MSYYQALGLTKEPFSNSPDPDMLYQARTHLECLQHMEIAVRLRRGLNVVLGDVGTGKTTLSRELVRLLTQDGDFEVHLLDDPSSPSAPEFLLSLARLFRLDVAAAGRDVALLKDAIKDWLLTRGLEGGPMVALLIDEGQKISPDGLELLRELLNFETNTHKLLQIIIFAQTEFEEALIARPNLDDRVNYRCRLLPLDRQETQRMIETRMALCTPDGKTPRVFTRLSLRRIHRLTGGYPRKIVRLCHLSMLQAVGFGKRRITWGMVGRAMRAEHGAGRVWLGRLAMAGTAAGLAAACLYFAGPTLPDARLAALDALGRLQTQLRVQAFDPAPAAAPDAPALETSLAATDVSAPMVPEQALPPVATSPDAATATPVKILAAQGTVGRHMAVAPGVSPAATAEADPQAAPDVRPTPTTASQGLGTALALSAAALPPETAEQVVVAPEYADQLQVAPAVVTAEPAPTLAGAPLPEALGEVTVRAGWAVTRQAARIYGNGGRAVMARLAKANPGIDFNHIRAGETITFPAIAADPLPQGAFLVRVSSAGSLEKAFAVISRQREVDLSLFCTQQPGHGLRFDVVLARQFTNHEQAQAALAELPRELVTKAELVDGFPADTVTFTDLGAWHGRRVAPKIATPATAKQVAASDAVTAPLP